MRSGVLFILLLTALAVRADIITVAAEDGWPPYSGAGGQGLSRQLAEAALATQGIGMNVVVVPYARALNQTMAGQADACWNVTRQASTEAQFVFGREPLLQATASYYYRAGQEQTYQSPADIPDGTRIAVINGYEYGDEFEMHRRRLQLMEVSKQRQMIELLLSGRVDMAIFFDRVLDYNVRFYGYDPERIRRGGRNHTSDIYIAFSRANPRAAELADRLDQGLQTLQRNGDYQRILAEY